MSALLDRLLALRNTAHDNALLRFGLATEYARLQAWPEAVAEARAALQQQPDFSAAWKLLGKALAAGGELVAALAAYQQGMAVAEARGDRQAVKEMAVFARRLQRQLAESGSAAGGVSPPP